MIENTRKPFEIWEVGEEEYKLKLKTSAIVKLEEKYQTGLMNLIQIGDNLPPLNIMLQVTHAAMKDWHHGIKLEKVYDLFDRYCEEGGSQLDFYQKIYLGIFTVSGFFTHSMAEDMEKSMEEVDQ